MKRVFTVKIAFDLDEFRKDRLTESYVESVLQKNIGSKGVETQVVEYTDAYSITANKSFWEHLEEFLESDERIKAVGLQYLPCKHEDTCDLAIKKGCYLLFYDSDENVLKLLQYQFNLSKKEMSEVLKILRLHGVCGEYEPIESDVEKDNKPFSVLARS